MEFTIFKFGYYVQGAPGLTLHPSLFKGWIHIFYYTRQPRYLLLLTRNFARILAFLIRRIILRIISVCFIFAMFILISLHYDLCDPELKIEPDVISLSSKYEDPSESILLRKIKNNDSIKVKGVPSKEIYKISVPMGV